MGQTLRQVLADRWGEDWLIGPDSEAFWGCLGDLRARFASSTHGDGAVLIAEANPLVGLGASLAAWAENRTVVLANPRWGTREQQQLQTLVDPQWQRPVQPGLGCYPCRVLGGQPGQLLIPTGGSSGQIKFAVHTWDSLMASVEGFCAHFAVEQTNAYCVLPLFHVSGLMQALRVLATGGQLALQPYGDLKGGDRLALPPGGFLSLVPTQLHDLLGLGEAFIPWLRSFRAVLVGGAPAGRSLLAAAQAQGIPVALTYGMTETASQVATLWPQEFLAGNRSSGKPLPHAAITIGDEGGALPGQPGPVIIQAKSLAQGYLQLLSQGPLPSQGVPTVQPAPNLLATDDMGYFDSDGYLHILGRSSTKLISGGENVFPEAVEEALLAIAGVQDSCLVGLPCDRWGQQLCALVVLDRPLALEDLAATLRSQLAPYKQPKQWVQLEALPRTTQGKLRRPQALALAQRLLQWPGPGPRPDS